MINVVHNSDCLLAMREMKDNQFDLAIVDPPFGIGEFQQSDANYAPVDWNNKTPPKQYFKELQRVSKNQIIFGANYYNSFYGHGGAIVWNKLNPHPSMSDCEIASCSIGKRIRMFYYEWHGYVVKQKEPNSFHPCQKPVALYKWLLNNYAKEGDTILDTHAGSMSSVIASIEMGHSITAYEIDNDYFNAGKKRVLDYFNQENMFRNNVDIQFIDTQ